MGLRYISAHDRSIRLRENGHLPGNVAQPIRQKCARSLVLYGKFSVLYLISALTSIVDVICKLPLQHLLPLPFFLTLAPNIYDHWKFALASEPLELSLIGAYMPKLIVYLIGNVLTQYPFAITISKYIQTHCCYRTDERVTMNIYRIFSLTVCLSQILVHQFRVCVNDRMQLTHRHSGDNTAKVPIPDLFYNLLQEPIYSVSLDRHFTSLRRYNYIYGSATKD